MALPNGKELALLDKFRAMLSDVELTEEQNSDMFLVGWLRARDLDLNKANDMLRKSLKWRKEHKIADVLNWEPPVRFHSEYYFEITGKDSEGCPVLALPFGKWDIRKAVEGGQREEWLRYIDMIFALLFKAMKENSKDMGRPVTQARILFKFDGFGMRQLTSLSNLNTILEFVRRFESNYPEMLKAVYILNATRVFTILFRCVKPLLSPRTLGKVEIYGTNQEEWKKVLRRDIPADQYPVEFGGSLTGYGSKLLLNGSRHGSISHEGNELLPAVVRAGDQFKVTHKVAEDAAVAAAELSWKFRTIDYDMGFMIVHNDDEHVHPHQRLDSHLEIQKGSISCEKPGKYVIIFDNSHSRFREKHLHYHTELLVPVS